MTGAGLDPAIARLAQKARVFIQADERAVAARAVVAGQGRDRPAEERQLAKTHAKAMEAAAQVQTRVRVMRNTGCPEIC